jgi:hypothetical protein
MPFETIALDFITKLPVSQGYDSILTVTDHDCTKASIFIPCNEEINAEGTAALYIQHVFAHFGLPRKVISNRDPRFISKFMQEVCRITGIECNPSMAYHLRTDGQSERSNQWVETTIRFISNHHQTNWAPYLPIAQFAHNNWPSDTTQKSPFFLLMGYNLHADWISAPSPLPQVTLRLEQLKQAQETAQQLMIKAQQSWVKHRDTPKYKEGDQVWLEGKNLRINQLTAKLAPRRHGPFKVVQVMSPVNYRLELPTQWSIHPVFHIDLLTPYKETIMHGPNYQRPLPNLVDGEEEYSVEKILDSRLFGRRRRLQYLVKWEGYPDSDNMWVDKDDVFADDKVREFKQSNPDKRTHIRTLRYVNSPHPSIAPTSQLLIQHAHKYMSSNGDNDLAHEYPAGVYDDTAARDELLNDIQQAIVDAATNYTADQLRRFSQPALLNELFVPLDPAATPFKPRSPSPSAQSIANTFRQLSIHTPTQLTPDGAAVAEAVRTHPYEVSVPASAVVGDEDGESLASGAPRTSSAAVRQEEPTTHRSGTRSRSTSVLDDTYCPRCAGPREYCHGHSPDNNPTLPIPAPPTPLPVPAPALPTHRVATFNLNRAQAEALAAQLATALQQDSQNPAEVPPPYPIQAEAAQGMGIRGRRSRGRGQRGGNRPVQVHGPPPSIPRPVISRRPVKCPNISTGDLHLARQARAQGFEENIGRRYVPVHILGIGGEETPACFIKVHMMDNPYVEAHMSPFTAVYRGEIHAIAEVDNDNDAEELLYKILKMLEDNFQDAHHVDAALDRIPDLSLEAEVQRWRGLKKRIKGVSEQIRLLEDRLYSLGVDQWSCWQRLQNAKVINRVLEEMSHDQRVHPLTPWSVEHGRLP